MGATVRGEVISVLSRSSADSPAVTRVSSLRPSTA